MPVVEHPEAERLGQRQRQARATGVVAEQPRGVGETGDRKAVLRLLVVDRVAACEVAARFGGHVRTASEHLGSELEGHPVTRPAEQVDRDQRLAAHRVDVRQRVGRRDPAPVVGVVDHRREEVRGHHHGPSPVDAHHRTVVAVLEPDEEVVVRLAGVEPGQHPLELAHRDLAGTPATGRELRQPDGVLGGRHAPTVPRAPCAPAVPCAPSGARRRTSGRAPMRDRPRRCRTAA